MANAYKLFVDDDFSSLLDLINSTDEPEWQLCNDGEVRVWRRPDKKNKALIVMRASITVTELDPLDVISVWRDIEYRFAWDDRCVKNICHETIGEGEEENELGYYEANAPPPMSNRDFVVQSGFRNKFKGENQWLFMNKSIDHPNFPEVKGIVRGISFITGTQVLSNDDGSTTVNYVTNGDVGGWIPKAVTNFVVTKAAPGMMLQLVKSAKGYKEWKEKRDQEKKE